MSLGQAEIHIFPFECEGVALVKNLLTPWSLLGELLQLARVNSLSRFFSFLFTDLLWCTSPVSIKICWILWLFLAVLVHDWISECLHNLEGSSVLLFIAVVSGFACLLRQLRLFLVIQGTYSVSGNRQSCILVFKKKLENTKKNWVI